MATQAKPRNIKPAPMSEAQRMEAISRGFTQQYQSIAQGVLYNLIGSGAAKRHTPAKVAEKALAITSAFLKKIGPEVDACFDAVVKAGTPAPEKKEDAK